jgi:phosphoribosylformylglycinamidine synthase subunit PurL
MEPRPPTELHRSLGLTDDEAARVEEILGRVPNELELAMYAVMWSEHCSYKSSRRHLKRLPTEADHVIVGPGENAGVIDAGDGIAVALRIESHNHPSAVEPYQGAATGVGGILRDIFTMGARPIALMDPLFFGPLDDPRNRWLAEGVVSGISGYGNSVGVPTVGGELTFSPGYDRNPLVNVLCVGVMPRTRLVLGRATGPGNLAVLLGATTGRDGIGGVSVLASAAFGSDDGAGDTKRPSVQVGDPFEEKRLIEACLELLDRGLVVGIQDLGGAGLTCATSETAGRGGVGMDVFVDDVPRREPAMTPVEVMTSESQERMLAIVAPDDRHEVEEVCRRWEVRATVIGVVTTSRRLRVLDGAGVVLADVPAASLSDDAPLYDRPCIPPVDLDRRRDDDPGRVAPWATARSGPAGSEQARSEQAGSEQAGLKEDLLALLADASWVYRQYDHQLFLNTVLGPGEDAAVLRLAAPGLPPNARALALSTDSNPRWCALDPRRGTAMTVAESALNVACAGARPLALVNCLNFGDPEHPEVMWQLSECVDGMAEACLALGIPVVGGNVSLYNANDGVDIDPTPVVAVLGIVDHLERRPPGMAFRAGSRLVLLGDTEPSLAGSRWAVERHGLSGGVLPALDLEVHARLVALTARLASEADLVTSLHDVSGGGLAVTLAECAVASGVGCAVHGMDGPGALFAESPSRVVVGTESPSQVLALAADAGISAREVGSTAADTVTVDGLLTVTVSEAADAWRRAIPDALGEPVTA